jgi:hypothetical protein
MSDTANHHNRVQEKVQRILRAAGIESSPIDPSSMMALQQMVMEKARLDGVSTSSLQAATAAAGAALAAGNLKAPPPQSSPFPLQLSSGGIAATDQSASHNYHQTNNNSGSSDDALLAQLQYQTRMMLQLQQQIQALHVKVDSLERKSNGNAAHALTQDSSSPNSINSDRSFNMSRTKIYMRPSASEDEREEPVTTTAATAASTNAPQQEPRPDVTEQQQQAEGPDRNRRRNNGHRITIQFSWGDEPPNENGQVLHPQPPPPEHILISIVLFPFRLVYVTLLGAFKFEVAIFTQLWRTLRQQVRPIDAGMLFQLFFVSLMVRKLTDDPERQEAMTGLVLTGFLYHIKVLQVLWKFFVTDNVPRRIFREQHPLDGDAPNQGMGGEDNEANANDNAPRNGALPQPPNNQDNDANEVNNDRWEETFPFGGIAAPDNVDGQGGQQHPISRFVWDIIYLFGSFVFSIFPMWRPEQRPRPPAAQEEEQPQNAIPNDNNGVEQLLPQVRPPRDAMEAADDSSEDESSEQGSEGDLRQLVHHGAADESSDEDEDSDGQ